MQARSYNILLAAICCLSLFSKLWLVNAPTEYYFDEDYHIETAQLIRTQDMRAFEWWHEPLTYRYVATLGRPTTIEWLHPPVAKYLQALSILLLGDTPFGWRMPSVLAGTGTMVVLMLIACRFGRDRLLVPVIGLVSVVDGLLFVQSRIATNDAIAAFFVVLTLYSMFRYQRKLSIASTVQLGVVLGFGVATKWSVAFVLPATIIGVWLSSPQALQKIKNSVLVLLICGLTYTISYLPSLMYHGPYHIYNLHKQVLSYHFNADFSHEYSSSVSEWVLNAKPTKLYVHTAADSKSVIYNAQNPALTLIAALSIGWLLYRKVVKNDPLSPLAITSLIFIAATLLPWLFIQRPIFFYHYLPSSVLLSIPISVFLVEMYRYTLFSKTVYWLLMLTMVGCYGWLLPIWTGTSLVNFNQHSLWWYMVPLWR